MREARRILVPLHDLSGGGSERIALRGNSAPGRNVVPSVEAILAE